MQPVFCPSLITNFSCSYTWLFWKTRACLSFGDKSEETQDRKKHPLTYHLQGCYLAGGQEEERETRVPTSELNRDELPHPFFPSLSLLFLSSFYFPSLHTQEFTRRSVILDECLDRFGVSVCSKKLNSELGKSCAEAAPLLQIRFVVLLCGKL